MSPSAEPPTARQILDLPTFGTGTRQFARVGHDRAPATDPTASSA